MRITFWGIRGSLPTPGPQTLRYGGNTTCLEFRLSDGTVLVLDAGSGVRTLGRKLMAEQTLHELYLVLTHSHWDHLMGFPFFGPAYSSRFRINVRGGPIAKETVRKYLQRQMEPPYFPVTFSAMKAEFDFTHGIPIVRQVGPATLRPIPLSHPNGGYGFSIEDGGKKVVVLTDNELGYAHEGAKDFKEYVRFCEEADLLLHDAQYTIEEYERFTSWGHSTYNAAVDLAVRAKARRLALIHHDPDHTDEDMDRIEQVSKQAALRRNPALECFAAKEGMTIEV